MSNQKGYFLPSVMFICMIVFIVLTAHIQIYSNSLHMTDKIVENIKLESLFQMSYTKFQEDVKSFTYTEQEQTIHYEFPDGTVEIKYFFQEMDSIHLMMNITSKNQAHYSITKQIKISHD
ncbi:hypothetical protein SAMN05216389_102391 [Oceanobacillus limi]|uniref:ComG operon protein 7 n=1 Tax=Oceanobacillus limi TaxID=930131 RepID=A0A1H9ZRR1_9BACI|nr:hypothetical protein [Oceanobacillus limi]SES83514.1 hypothetical protein SAMN05216389_102391 [Oceanobacillus limi]